MKRYQYPIKQVVFGSEMSYKNGVLTLVKEKVEEIATKGIEGYKISLDVAHPGESTRIIHITDTVEPAYKKEGATFFGWTEGENKSGETDTVHLTGMTVMQTCEAAGIQEGIVDMTGEVAKYNPFSQTVNLVISFEIVDTVEKPKLQKDLKDSILRTAEFVAKVVAECADENEATIETLELAECTDSSLPKVGYVYYIQAQGPLRNVFIDNKDRTTSKPEFFNPLVLLDGALISANYIIACQKNATIHHQNNKIILDLIAKHNKEVNFIGVIVATESSSLEGKKENASIITEIAKSKGIEGVIVTQEGGGHADVDLMMTLDECVKEGIKVVLLTNEISGVNGDLPPLVSGSPNANAIVTNGNNDSIITTDEVKKAIGGTSILNGKFNATSSFDTSLGIIYTATNQLGANKMTTILK